MSNIEVLKELQERGALNALVKTGWVRANVRTAIEMYHHVNAQVLTGVHKTDACIATACSFGVSERTVWRALNSLL